MTIINKEMGNIPPIIGQYIRNMFDSTIREHVRDNYRDNIHSVLELCQEAIKEFDKKKSHNKIFGNNNKNRK